MGHGGTLDPLATGVLVVGVGRGTKEMNSFLGCTKTYETVVLFGKSTDTYDVAGKISASAPYQHVTRALVEEKLCSFRGKIKQMPPIYSSLKINGKKAYEYARTGTELPRELKAREMEVHECEIVEWVNGGEHEHRWPATELWVEDKNLAKALIAVAQDGIQSVASPRKRKLCELLDQGNGVDDEGGTKNRSVGDEGGRAGSIPEPCSMQDDRRDQEASAGSHTSSSAILNTQISDMAKAKLHTHEIGPLSSEICPAPAVRIRLTVSSGFYVRSFAHDLGLACDSLALMASLARSRQAQFHSESALNYKDLEGGEQLWGPKVQQMLELWNEQSSKETGPHSQDQAGTTRETKTTARMNVRARKEEDAKRRNTSSAEE
jgi:tRNA pseudouridine55 synthase